MQTLRPTEPDTYDAFGRSVALSGDNLFIGSTRDVDGGEVYPGKAYFFRFDGSSWNQVQVVSAPNSYTGDRFGSTVDIDGDYAVVGGVGEVSVYTLVGGSWQLRQSIAPTGVATGRVSVAIAGDYIVLGNDENGEKAPNAGKAWVYRLQDGIWEEVAALLPATAEGNPDAAEGNRFGYSLDIKGENAIIGAYNLGKGAAFIQRLLLAPKGVAVSDGNLEDRIQVTWADAGKNENNYNIYRRNAKGELDLIGTTPADIEVFDDFSAVAGGSFEYCVTSYNPEIEALAPLLGESNPTCDVGWRPTNGAISGQVSALGVLSAQAEPTSDEAEVKPSEESRALVATVPADGANVTFASLSMAAAPESAVDICLDPNPNQALLLDGVGGHVSVGYVERPAQMTVCGWIKTTVPGEGMQVLSWANDQTGDLVFWQVFGGTLFYGQVGTGNFSQLGSAVPVNNGQWVHACVVRDGDNASMYLNGEPSGSAAGFGFPLVTNTLTIGGFKNSTGVSGFFDGAIDEIQIWNSALDGAAIKDNMSTKLTGNEAGLIGYWPFDQGQGRVAPDLSSSVTHGKISDGGYWISGPSVGECTRSDNNGNYTVSGIRYGEKGTFTLTPKAPRRSFSPASKEITLSVESPIENQVDFVDNSQFGISGIVQFQGTECPVPDVEIAVDGEFKTKSASDGTYSTSVFPSDSPTDLRRVTPGLPNPQDPSDRTLFQPQRRDLFVDADTSGVDFASTKTRFLRGFYGGSCDVAGDLGTASVRLFTEDGCFDQTITVREAFELELPPQKYLVQAMPNAASAPPALLADMITFFDDLGAREVDLTLADDTLDFIYRPEVEVEIVGLDPPSQCTNLTADDRTLPLVPIIGRGELVPLTIRVSENYGSGSCPVDKGTVQIFDAIADSVESPRTLQIENGEVSYSTYGASPNVFSGAFVDGVDRSFQKPITAIASVEGRGSTSVTEWAIVEGLRVRTAEFVSATTDPFPIMILRDPPGSNSYAFMEKEAEVCTNLSQMQVTGGNAGFNLDTTIGLYTETGFSLGAHLTTEFGVGIILRSRTKAGRDNGTGGSFEICMSNSERWATSADATWVGEDLFMGVALNLVFARADELKVNTCNVAVSEKLAADLDPESAFETTYVYGGTHIKQSLIPALEELIAIAGDETLSGDPDGDGRDDSVSLTQALDNWRRQLAIEDSLATAALDGEVENISFSAGAEYGYTHKASEAIQSERSLHASTCHPRTRSDSPWLPVSPVSFGDVRRQLGMDLGEGLNEHRHAGGGLRAVRRRYG